MPMFGRQSPEHEGARLPRRRLSLYAAGTRAHEVKNHFVASGITEHECTNRLLIEKLSPRIATQILRRLIRGHAYVDELVVR
jgi:hypothetical protein